MCQSYTTLNLWIFSRHNQQFEIMLEWMMLKAMTFCSRDGTTAAAMCRSGNLTISTTCVCSLTHCTILCGLTVTAHNFTPMSANKVSTIACLLAAHVYLKLCNEHILQHVAMLAQYAIVLCPCISVSLCLTTVSHHSSLETAKCITMPTRSHDILWDLSFFSYKILQNFLWGMKIATFYT